MRPPPSFRAEHVGSLLRPPALLAARRAADEGRLSADTLRAEEDALIREAVRLQEEIGLEPVTDGEYRRGIYFGHFGAAVTGFTEMDAEMTFRGAAGTWLPAPSPASTSTRSSSSTTRRLAGGSSRCAMSRLAASSSSAWCRPRRLPPRMPTRCEGGSSRPRGSCRSSGWRSAPNAASRARRPGNPLTPAEQRRKLELVVDAARRVWR